MWAICDRCHTVYTRDAWRSEQRFCCRTCSRLYRYHGPIDMDDTNQLRDIAERCHRFIVNAGDAKGVTDNVLERYIDPYSRLTRQERECVHLFVTKRTGIAFLEAGNGLYRFWPRYYAPEEAVRA